MRVVFMGTPEFAASILYELDSQHEIVGVYTRPDAVRGRGKKLVSSPVAEVAEKLELPIFKPTTLRSDEAFEELKALQPDVICVAAYGMILPKNVLELPCYGCINVHASLLPKYRGAAPIERAILNGDYEAGVCIMKMEEGLDTGPYCISRSCEIADLSCQKLTGDLSDKGACALLSALYELSEGKIRWIEQDDAQATYAAKLEKGELFLHPDDEVEVNARRVQASSEAHPSRCIIADKTITVIEARKVSETDAELVASITSGMVFFVHKRLFIGMANGVLELLCVKPDGKKEMEARSFAAGIQGIKSGTITWESL